MQSKSVTVVCPDCGWVQDFRPHQKWKKIKGSHRTECKRCGRSFKVLDRVESKVNNHRRKKDESKKPFGFHKYSKQDD